jgi:hypothetical protein
MLQVEAGAQLVAVVLREVGAAAAGDMRRKVAHVVGIAGMLDLDHRRPQVREHHRAVRTGDDAAQVDDGDAGERQGPRAFRRVGLRGLHVVLRSVCRAARAHQPPRASQSSTSSSRSEPQNGSPSTNTNGEPKTPRSSEAATASRRSVRDSSLSMPATSAASSSPEGRGERGDLVVAREVAAEAPVAVEGGVREGAFPSRVMALDPAERACRRAGVHHGVAHLARHLDAVTALVPGDVVEHVGALQRRLEQRLQAHHLHHRHAEQHAVPAHAAPVAGGDRLDAQAREVAVAGEEVEIEIYRGRGHGEVLQ